eukprot:COSAG01_NODE_401_length_17529_cov_47.865806_8_plen_166_part_00
MHNALLRVWAWGLAWLRCWLAGWGSGAGTGTAKKAARWALEAILEQEVASTKLLPDFLRVERAPALAVTRLLSDGHRSEMWRWFASLDEAGRRAASRRGGRCGATSATKWQLEGVAPPPPPHGHLHTPPAEQAVCAGAPATNAPATNPAAPTNPRTPRLSVCLSV